MPDETMPKETMPKETMPKETMTEEMLNRVYLALGSNIEPERHLPAAVERLADYGRIVAVSSVWESAAVGDPNQPNFLNAAILLETELTAQQVKRSAIGEIEQTLGRVRDPSNKNAARTIDIDIALFNCDVFTLDENQIPDAEILTRPFLAVPLSELDPAYRHPIENRTLLEIADGLRGNELQRRNEIRLTESLPESRR